MLCILSKPLKVGICPTLGTEKKLKKKHCNDDCEEQQEFSALDLSFFVLVVHSPFKLGMIKCMKNITIFFFSNWEIINPQSSFLSTEMSMVSSLGSRRCKLDCVSLNRVIKQTNSETDVACGISWFSTVPHLCISLKIIHIFSFSIFIDFGVSLRMKEKKIQQKISSSRPSSY